MKKLLSLALAGILATTSLATQAGDFTAAQMKKMSVFLSNFTELGFLNFKTADFVKDNGAKVVFGVWHNYINNKANISDCSQCKWGNRAVDHVHVREALKRYFDYNMTTFPQVDQDGYPLHYDGRRYQFYKDDQNWSRVYATVFNAKWVANGRIEMRGQYYLPDKHNEVVGKFKALAKPHVWRGKDTWAIIELKYPVD